MECVFSKKTCWGPTIYCSNQKKENWNAKIRTLQEKRIEYEAIKILCLERWPDFCRWRRGASGHPQDLTLVPLGYLLGWHGRRQLELLSILHLISSFSFPYTWKLPSYKTLHNSISIISVSMIVNLLFWFSFNSSIAPIKE
jgi:hypothetical protein